MDAYASINDKSLPCIVSTSLRKLHRKITHAIVIILDYLKAKLGLITRSGCRDYDWIPLA